MVAKYASVSAAAVFLLFLGCTDLTEFDHTIRAGINIVSTPDLAVVHTIDNLSGVRSLCAVPGLIIAATTDGQAFRFNSETYEQTGSFIIGSPASSGYFEMEYSPTESSVYIIGAFGQISEFGVPDVQLLDNFSVCETPVDIEIGTQIELPYLYVAGSTSETIYEVRLTSNIVSRSCKLYSSPVCMAIDQAQDTILIGTLGETEIVSIRSGAMMNRQMPHIPGILAIEPVPDDTVFTAVFDYSSPTLASVLHYFPDMFSGSPMWTGLQGIEGSLYYMVAESDGGYAYVLTYIGDNVSRLFSYNCLSYQIEKQVDFQGYPLDLDICSGGTLLVLTAQ